MSIEQKGVQAEELPSEVTINTKMNDLGYRLRAVKKSRPKQKIPETDAIFEQLNQIHRQAQEDETL